MMIRGFVVLALLAPPVAAGQLESRATALVEAVKPALPFPSADAEGELPAQGGSQEKWFVVWPRTRDDQRIHVKANPLHPSTQAAAAAAMGRIQEAVEAAERKAQAAYDRAVEQLKRTGKPSDIEGVTLDDEGIAGERIDAELELLIALNTGVQSFEIGSSVSPTTTPGSNGVTWIISIPPNAYREKSVAETRDRFRAAETRVIFGVAERPKVNRRGDDDHFVVTIAPAANAFSVVIRGNEDLLAQVVTSADWSRLARPTP